ncbi:MAG: hypothetical protein ACRDWH_08055, partial [Acidimicrobiia bacterium]
MSQVTATSASVEVELRPAPPVDLRRAIKLGLSCGAAMILVAATGIVATFQGRLLIDPILPLGLLFLYLMPFVFGWMAGQPGRTIEGFAPAIVGRRNLLAGAIAGAVGGALIGLLVILMSVFNLRGVFVQLSPQLADIITFNLPVAAAIVAIIAISTAAGVLG